MKARWRFALRMMERMLAVTGLLFLTYHAGFDLLVMTSPSMSPTLKGTARENGDWVLSERITRHFREPKRWEVVLFDDNEGIPVMKRVVGLPGETIGLKKFQATVNGAVLERPKQLEFLKYYAYGNLSSGRTCTATNGYYVLGDDSKDSNDSRFEGVVEPGRIRGRAWLRVWPAGRIGWVNP